ncbi:hypothetical protein [Nannocystis pusilla]|uniref:hypothetical protein n=1 Tax=Nannocystis pusilla TaxID=889268 RepID=UPI003DA51EEF
MDDGARASRNCTLPGSNPNKWKSRELVPIWMGQPPRYEREGEDRDWFRPLEDAEEDGCPGGWYRCGFTASLQRYRRTGSEAKTENLFLSRCEDKLVLEAISYLEDEERHALNAFYEARDAAG